MQGIFCPPSVFPNFQKYSRFEPHILFKNCEIRRIGSITVDKQAHGRYSEEVQMLCRCFPADPQVYVLGAVAPGFPAPGILREKTVHPLP